ncbi:hypothetical protein ACVWXN_001578 [Bradyrhizobium sp. i1.4.4]|uniref:hypothetical protein n=1 Tax=Bradyrhizobium sp. RT10b TaxID=3156331 RepID=UPI003399D117
MMIWFRAENDRYRRGNIDIWQRQVRNIPSKGTQSRIQANVSIAQRRSSPANDRNHDGSARKTAHPRLKVTMIYWELRQMASL